MLDIINAHRYLYYFLKNQSSLVDLEQWLYEHEELESILGKSEYLELISRDYKNKYAFHETEKQIRRLVKFGVFEHERIVSLLERLITNHDPLEFLNMMETIYDEYCDGYTFLRYIALTSITTSAEYQEVLKMDSSKFINYKKLITKEANRLLRFLKNNEIYIEEEHEFIDKRREQDRIEIHSINEMLNNQSNS